MQFSDIRDGSGRCEQAKEGTRLVIPLTLSLNALAGVWTIWCAAVPDNVVSGYLLHHTKPRTYLKPGEQVWIDTITKGFRRALARSDVTWDAEKTPPTFHEIRSLAERLYAEQGNVNTQELLGHRDRRALKLQRLY